MDPIVLTCGRVRPTFDVPAARKRATLRCAATELLRSHLTGPFACWAPKPLRAGAQNLIRDPPRLAFDQALDLRHDPLVAETNDKRYSPPESVKSMTAACCEAPDGVEWSCSSIRSNGSAR